MARAEPTKSVSKVLRSKKIESEVKTINKEKKTSQKLKTKSKPVNINYHFYLHVMSCQVFNLMYRQCDCKLRLYKVKITYATNNQKGAKRLKESIA